MSMRRVIVLALLGTGASGCFLWTSRGEGDELTQTSDEHERRLDELEKGIAKQRQELNDGIALAKTKVTELEDVLQRATKVVTRNSADLGLQIERLQEQIGQLEGEIATLRQEVADRERTLASQRQELDQRLSTIASKAGLDVEIPESEIPRDKTEHYQTAYRLYQNGDFSRSRALFRLYVQRYGQDDEADNALYWSGKTYLRQERPANALGEFRRVIADYPRGDALDETLLDMADAFYQLQACGDARTALQTLIRSHPRSNLVARARTKLREIDRAPRDYCR